MLKYLNYSNPADIALSMALTPWLEHANWTVWHHFMIMCADLLHKFFLFFFLMGNMICQPWVPSTVVSDKCFYLNFLTFDFTNMPYNSSKLVVAVHTWMQMDGIWGGIMVALNLDPFFIDSVLNPVFNLTWKPSVVFEFGINWKNRVQLQTWIWNKT